MIPDFLLKDKVTVREPKGTFRYSEGYNVVKVTKQEKKLKPALHGSKLLYRNLVNESIYKDKKNEMLFSNRSTNRLESVVGPSKFVNMNTSFEEKLKDIELESLPLASELIIEQCRWPVVTEKTRKRIETIASSIGKNDGGTIRLRLNNEGITDDLLKILAKALYSNNFLQSLMLHDNAITDNGVIELTKSLINHPSLHVLCLGDNYITDVAVHHLCELLIYNRHITDLNIANRWPGRSWLNTEQAMHPHIGIKGGVDLARVFSKGGCSLTSLSLQFQKIQDEGAAAIFHSLPCCNLRTLNLECNGLSDACCKKLNYALISNCLLEQLVLSRNSIGDEGVTDIAEGLHHNIFLQALDLSNNRIDTSGMEALLRCLEVNRTLSTIATFNNISTDDRAEVIVNVRMKKIRREDYHAAKPLEATSDLSQVALNSMEKIWTLNSALTIAEANERAKCNNTDLDIVSEMKEASSGESSRQGSPGRKSRKSSLAIEQLKRLPSDSALLKRAMSVTTPESVADSARSKEGLSGTSPGSGSRPGSGKSRPGSGKSRPGSGRGSGVMKAVSGKGSGLLNRRFSDKSMLEEGDSSSDEETRSPIGRLSRQTSSHKLSSSMSPSAEMYGKRGLCRELSLSNILIASSAAQRSIDAAEARSRSQSPDKAAQSLSAIGEKNGAEDMKNENHYAQKPQRRKAMVVLMKEHNETVVKHDVSEIEDNVECNNKVELENATKETFDVNHKAAKSLYGRPRNAKHGASDSSALVHMASSHYESTTNIDHIRSKDLGKSIALPKLGNMGSLPIKTHSNAHGDSGGHLMYLRSATQADRIAHAKGLTTENDSMPTSYLQIARNYAIEQEKLKRTHQTLAYKMRKQELLSERITVNKQRGALKPPPDYFWEENRLTLHLKYPNGIDKSKGVYSTNLDDANYALTASNYAQIAARKKMFAEIASTNTPGEILGIKRVERIKALKKKHEEILEQEASK